MLTLATARERLWNYCSPEVYADATDAQKQAVDNRINEARERMFAEGTWLGMVERVTFTVTDRLLTLPREYGVLLGVNSECGSPQLMANQWYEFHSNGWGTLGDCTTAVVDRGEGYRTFKDIAGTIKVVSELDEDEEAEILFRGLDDDGNRILTDEDGEIIEGERILVNGTNSGTEEFASIYSVVKPVTNGRILVYAVDGATETLIATYEPGETVPNYRRYFIPNSEDDATTIVALVKRKFIEVTHDDDLVVPGSLGALKLACKALNHEDKGDYDIARGLIADSIRLLNADLTQYHEGSQVMLTIQGSDFAAGSIQEV